ncbi:uncharacterized protein AB9W97_015094 isoform 1-T1 [Spinachia spinachia]
MPVFKKWTDDEGDRPEEPRSSAAAEKRYREPTASKTARTLKKSCPNPSTPTGTETRRSITECASRKPGPLTMSSPDHVGRKAPSVQSLENGKEEGIAACQKPERQAEGKTTNLLENRDIQEEFITSLSVCDGRYLVDLGSSSGFIVDEECILQLFNSCRKCNRRCTVKKRVDGLKLVVDQACGFCKSRSKWTNLPDDEDDAADSQINGEGPARVEADSAQQ